MENHNKMEEAWYEDIGAYDKEKNIRMLRNRHTGQILLKKERRIFHREVYDWLVMHPVPGVPRIYFVTEEGDRLILIEEMIDGMSLAALMDQEPALVTEEQIRDWMLRLLSIIRHFHHANPPIVHRDLKAENIVISSDLQLYLVDCNSARQYVGGEERDTQLLGTVGYAAPEQYGFGESDQRTDIYAFGVLLNYLLTGSLSRQKIAEGKWEKLIRKCLEIDPANRYPDVDALLKDFQAVPRAAATGHPQPQKRPGIRGRARPDGLFPDGWKDPRPPGYRTRRPLIFIPASIGYGILLLYTIDSMMTHYRNGGLGSMISDAIFTLALFLLPAFYLGDYLGMQSLFPGSRHPVKGIRILLLAFWTAVLLLIIAILAPILDPPV